MSTTNALSNVSKIDMNEKSMSIMSKVMHNPCKQNPEQSVDTKFVRSYQKTMNGSNSTVKLPVSIGGSITTYEPNIDFNMLKAIYQSVELPAIKVKPKFENTIQVSWCHNVMHNINEKGVLLIDNIPLQTINTIYLDVWSQLYMRFGAGFRELYDEMVGSQKTDTGKWINEMPSFKMQCPQPYYFSSDISKALPLFLVSSMSRITFQYNYKLNYSQLIRMRAREPLNIEEVTEARRNYNKYNNLPNPKSKNGEGEGEQIIIPEIKWSEWKCIPYNHTYLESVTSRHKIPLPEMWGRYTMIHDDELEWRRESKRVIEELINNDDLDDVNLDEENIIIDPNQYYTQDMILCTNEDLYHYGDVPSISLDCKTQAYQYVVLAQNIDGLVYNNRSNYTTDIYDVENGHNPVKLMGEKYKNEVRVPKMESYHYDRVEPWYTCRSAPNNRGFNVRTISHNPFGVHPDIGMTYDYVNSQVVVSLDDTNPWINKFSKSNGINNENEDNDDEFNIYIPEELQRKSDKKKSGPKFKIWTALLLNRFVSFDNTSKPLFDYNSY
uniref:Major capsid protein n=1 Tax=Pithovirus LCPAC101 TaxID=2506586 RepID=A0A481Z2N8_9VIRU|nr:MAG: major capsid protein [Pithovirus LCPAC101]